MYVVEIGLAFIFNWLALKFKRYMQKSHCRLLLA